MNRHPSRAFRRWCAGLIVLVFSWSMPAAVEARVSPVEVVKFQLKKPNFVVVVESAESMQGLPGENPARYNEVGADCENGDRFCRLYGQTGRCEFSGMGKHGYVFDEVPVYSGTSTSTSTRSDGTMVITQTDTGSMTKFTTAVVTSTTPNTGGETITRSTTATTISTATGTAYRTATSTNSETYYQTTTLSAVATSNATGTITGTQTYNTTSTKTGSQTYNTTSTKTGSQTYNTTSTKTGSQTYNTTSTLTGTQSYNTTSTKTGTQTYSTTSTKTGTETYNTTQIAYGSYATHSTWAGANWTFNHTLGAGTNKMVIIFTTADGGAVAGLEHTSVKYNNTAASYVGTTTSSDQWGGNAHRMDVWAVPVGSLASGTYAVTGTASSSIWAGWVTAISFSGVTQSTPAAASAWDNTGLQTLSVSRTAGINDWFVDGMFSWSNNSAYTYTRGAGQTFITSQGSTSDRYMGYSIKGPLSSGTSSSSWTLSSPWTTAALLLVHLTPALTVGTRTNTGTTTITASRTVTTTNTGTTTNTASRTATTTNTGTTTSTASRSVTTTNTGTTTNTASRSVTTTNTGTTTNTASRSVTTTNTGTNTNVVTRSVTSTNTATTTTTLSRVGTSTNSVTSTNTTSVPVTQTATTTATVSDVAGFVTKSETDLTTNIESSTHTLIKTATATTTYIVQPLPDTDPCTVDADCTGNSYCYLQSTKSCANDSECPMSGDFCRKIEAGKNPASRMRSDFCATSTPSKSCRYQAKSCSDHTSCGGAADGSGPDYCVSGIPARMCSTSGVWCRDSDNECTLDGGVCVDATSRMMMVKNAVRRVILEHAYSDAVAKFGHMHTYQTNREGNTVNLFPYVKLAEPTVERTETRLLTRAELLRGTYNGQPCFSESAGPSESCTIDYGAGGATSAPSVNYTRVTSGSNSRYAIPTGDGRTFSHDDESWANWADTCVTSDTNPKTSPVCRGQYEGSYYTFTYRWGKPIAVGDPANPTLGSVSNPQYFSSYQGKTFGSAGNYWMLMDAERSDIVNENKYGATAFSGATWSSSAQYPSPLLGANWDLAANTCTAWNGGQWDYNVVPMVNATTFGGQTMTPAKKGLLNAARFEKASFGGFHAVGSISPVGCMLKNDTANDSHHSVDGYMAAAKGADGSACWQNHVLMVVDGLPRGPGDLATGGIDCSAAACIYASGNEDLTGCNCPAVTKARSLARDRGVNVHVIAATHDLALINPYAAATLNNIARAGSTTLGFMNQPRYAANEDELYFWLNYEMKEALRVRVATTPASAANSSQSMAGITAGNMLYQTVADLPEWRGSLIGYTIGTVSVASTSTSTSTSTSVEVAYTTSKTWDAARRNGWVPCDPTTDGCYPPNDDNWKHRNVFFSDKSGVVRKIEVGTLGDVDSASIDALKGMGMGGDAAETQRIVQWMLGKLDPTTADNNPRPLNPAVMGSVINSMPISVGPPGMSDLPGGNHFYYTQAANPRPELVYVGADDGMLHAFEASSGEEKFAFIPADMVPVIARLHAQGGQRYNPDEHIYGLSGSPKVKNLCWENCQANPACSDAQGGTYDTSICPKWKTVLIMPEGKGGNHPFALDITNPIVDGDPNITSDSLLWHVGHKNAAALPASKLGDTMSVPAFAYVHDETRMDQRVLMASSYPPSGGSAWLLDAKLKDGSSSGGPGLEITKKATCSQDFGMVADVALARNYTRDGQQSLIAAYMADTYGFIHQYAPAFPTPPSNTVMELGCDHPLHFSPSVIQLNRVDASNENGTSVFLAQVTNSLLDPATRNSSTPSMLVITKLTSIGNSPPAADQAFGESGKIELHAGTSCTGTNCLCGKTEGIKQGTDSGCGSGGSTIPNEARPTGSPLAVIRSDGQGFQLFTTWYKPPAANWDNCPNSDTNGTSYITVHEFLANGTWAQIAGLTLPRQYVTGVQFVGTTLFVTYGTNEQAPGSPEGWNNFGQTFNSDDKTLQSRVGDRFIRTAWAERLDQ